MNFDIFVPNVNIWVKFILQICSEIIFYSDVYFQYNNASISKIIINFRIGKKRHPRKASKEQKRYKY